MSLRIWLPLTGNLNNNGVSGTIVTNYNVTFDTSGKLGSCALISTAGNKLTIPNPITTTTDEFSISCWFYITQFTNGYACLCCDRTQTSGKGIAIWIQASSMRIDTDEMWAFSKTTNLNTWYHFCLTWSKTKGKYVYINGVQVAYKASVGLIDNITSTLWIAESMQNNVGSYSLVGKLNDFRIYDHALSVKEIKEIAKGLICHYPLNGIGANENLFDFQSIASKWVQDGANVIDYEDGIYGNVLKVTATGNYKRIYRTVSNVWNQNQIYTVSFLAKADEEVSCNMSRSIANYSPNFTLSTEWKRYYGQITSTVTASGGTLSFTILSTNIPVYITQIKLELGDKLTPYLPGVGDQLYESLNIDGANIIDISGYKNNALNENNVVVGNENDSPRYIVSSNFNGTDSFIACGRGSFVKDEITISFWCYSADWSTTKVFASCTESGGYGFSNNNGSGTLVLWMGTGTSSNTYKNASAATKLTDLSVGWHMISGSYNGLKTKIYIDGTLEGTTNAYNEKTPIFYNATNGLFLGAEAAGTQTTPASGYYTACNLSDFRVYATALSDDDIKELYNIPVTISDKGNILTQGEFSENSDIVEFNSTGVVDTNNITEFICNIFDENVYVEPDGSTWIRIFHHNNPAGGSFSSTDTFTSQVYIDENRWFNVSLCNLISDNWELMIKQKAESDTATESKFRWIQTANPMIATYEQTLSANVTKISTAGYTVSTFGGAYLKNNSNTYLACNNGESSNWWGAIGSCVVYQGGIPAYNGVLVKTGYCDLYLRIDNANFDKFTIGENFITSREIIED